MVAPLGGQNTGPNQTFKHYLGHSLAPTPNKPFQEFMKYFACVVTQPHLYHEAIQYWNDNHPNNPIVEATGSTINIKHIGMVLDHTQSNHIPSLGIDHGYTFISWIMAPLLCQGTIANFTSGPISLNSNI